MNKTVKQLLCMNVIHDMALSSNVAYGKEIFRRDGIQIISETEDTIKAWVGGLSGDSKSGGGAHRNVWFYAKQSKFSWHCSENQKTMVSFVNTVLPWRISCFNVRTIVYVLHKFTFTMLTNKKRCYIQDYMSIGIKFCDPSFFLHTKLRARSVWIK